VVYAELPRAQHAFDVLPSVRVHHTVHAVERFLAVVRSGASQPPDARPPARPEAPQLGLRRSDTRRECRTSGDHTV
jgi:hypothetical protein